MSPGDGWAELRQDLHPAQTGLRRNSSGARPAGRLPGARQLGLEGEREGNAVTRCSSRPEDRAALRARPAAVCWDSAAPLNGNYTIKSSDTVD